jgi:hypothetical protein
MLTVVARAMKTPARHTCCWERRAASAPVPHAERRADAACSFHCPLPPSPAAPTQTTPTFPLVTLSWSVLQAPALTRLPCGNCTAPSVGAGLLPGHPDKSGFHGVARPSSPRLRRDKSLDFFESLTGSPHALSPAAGTARPASRHSAASSRAVRSSSQRGRRPLPTPPTCHAIARRATADRRLSGTRAQFRPFLLPHRSFRSHAASNSGSRGIISTERSPS